MADFKNLNEKLSDLRQLQFEMAKIHNKKIIDFFMEIKKYTKADNKLSLNIDGLHLSVKGNEIIANVVRTYLTSTYA